MSIVHCTKAIFLPPISKDGPLPNNVVRLLLHIVSSLLERFEKFEQPEGVKSSLEYLRYLRGLPLDSFDLRIPRNLVTISLIRALAAHVRLDTEDGTRNLKEMVTLCRELLTSNLSTDFPVAAFISLNRAVADEVTRGRPIQFIDEIIECLRDAAKVCPPGSYVFYALANRLYTRFIQTHSNDDYDDATAVLERILDPNQHGEFPDSLRYLASTLAAVLAQARSTIFKEPEYSEVAISRLRALLSSPFVDEGLRVQITDVLAMQTRERFTQYSLAESLEEANSYTSQVVDLSSSGSLAKSGEILLESRAVRDSYSTTRMAEKIQHLEELLSVTPPGTERHKECLTELSNWYCSKFYRSDDISDIEESIKYSRLSLNATHSGDPRRSNPIASLSNNLFLAFEKTGEISYLNDSITVGYDILNLRTPRHAHFPAIHKLVRSLLTREKLLGQLEDRHEAIRLISTVVDDQYAREPDRFRLSCKWAILARSISHPTTSTAYKSAMSLM